MPDHPWLRILLGGGLVLVGLPIALLAGGAVLLGECGAGCDARGERVAGLTLAALGLVATAAGAVLARAGIREHRAAR